MEQEETVNAKIRRTELGFADGRFMTFWIHLDYSGAGQAAGGYALCTPLKDEKGVFLKRVGAAKSMTLIMEILKVVDVEKWEDLPGKYIQVRKHSMEVLSIHNILDYNNCIDFKSFFSRCEDAE